MIHTYNEYHLGDNLVHLHYLRKVCEQNPDLEFVHHCNPALHFQLEPLCEYQPIELAGLDIPPGAINAWIGRENFFYNHPLRNNWVTFHICWFDYLSDILEVANPIACKEDFWFDYPGLKVLPPMNYDYLIINSPPASGQLPDYNPAFFERLVRDLGNAGKRVITTYRTGMAECTLDHGITVTGIGALSKGAKHIIGVATGPMWTTFNVFNANTVQSRTFYCAHQTVNLTNNTITRHILK